MKQEEKNLPAFPFLDEKKHVISLVGAGGKTTLMYAMAGAYCRKGYRVLVTTTTHIGKPEERHRARSFAEAEMLWQQNEYAVAGTDAPDGKLCSLDEKMLKYYIKSADIVLIEADGAKRMPCKVPAEHEPALPKECDIVVGVAGLDCVGRPLQEVCFRLEIAEKFLGKDGTELLTEEDLAKILSSRQGTRKRVGSRDYYVILNKCIDEGRRQSADRITGLLHSSGVEKVGSV